MSSRKQAMSVTSRVQATLETRLSRLDGYFLRVPILCFPPMPAKPVFAQCFGRLMLNKINPNNLFMSKEKAGKWIPRLEIAAPVSRRLVCRRGRRRYGDGTTLECGGLPPLFLQRRAIIVPIYERMLRRLAFALANGFFFRKPLAKFHSLFQER